MQNFGNINLEERHGITARKTHVSERQIYVYVSFKYDEIIQTKIFIRFLRVVIVERWRVTISLISAQDKNILCYSLLSVRRTGLFVVD